MWIQNNSSDEVVSSNELVVFIQFIQPSQK